MLTERSSGIRYRVGEAPWGTAAEAPVDLGDRGLLLGDGVFDTALALDGRVFRSADHLARLAAACGTLGIPIERQRLAAFHRLPNGADGLGVIRLTVTAGVGPRGVTRARDAFEPFVFASLAPADPSRRFAPLTLSTSAIPRNERSPASRLKMLGYQDALFGCWEAERSGADEPLFLNTRGRVACSATCNLFVLRGRRLRTPPLEEGVLAGVGRRLLLEGCATASGLSAEEGTVEPAELREADAVYATNSLRLLSRVVALDGAPLGDAPEVTAALERTLSARLERECRRP